MHRFITALLTLALVLGLAACGGGETPSATAPQPASTAALSSVSSAVGSETEAAASASEASFVKEELLAYIGQPLSALEDAYGREYYVYGVGEMTGALEYYHPAYICFYFDPLGYFNPSGLPENEWDEDPFVTDDLLIKWIGLQGEVDLEAGAVTNQDSLRALFATEEKITYSLLNEELGQAPELEYYESGGYQKIDPYRLPEWEALPNGTYSAGYVVEGVSVSVTFVQEGEEYVALSAMVGDMLEME